MAPKELEKILYFAASIITWVDQEARWRDLGELEGQMQEELDRLLAEERERVGELRTQLEARQQYLAEGSQADFNDEDHLWAESLDVNVKKLSDEERKKLETDLRKSFTADIDDTEAYYEDAHAPQGGLEALRQQGRALRARPPRARWPLAQYVERPGDKDEFVEEDHRRRDVLP